MNRWSKDEINFLKKNYSIKTNKEIQKVINRSRQAMVFQAGKLGLKKNIETVSKARKHTNIEITKEILEDLYHDKSKSIREIAKELSLGKNTIDYYLKKFYVRKRPKSASQKLAYKKYGNWKKGLTKESDERVFLAIEKMKDTYAKRRLEKLEKKQRELGESLNDAINRLYWKEKFSQEKIAEKLGISRLRVINLMKECDISKRPNFEIISNLRGKNHSMFGKTWEEIYGVEESKILKEERSIKSRIKIIQRLKNNEMPFINTKIEKILAKEMQQRGIIFTSQYSIDNKYVCDFAITKFRIIMECDGDYWHANPKIYDRSKLDIRQKRNVNRDKFKDIYLKGKGWVILRFFESDINNSVERCCDLIEKEIKKVKNPLDGL